MNELLSTQIPLHPRQVAELKSDKEQFQANLSGPFRDQIENPEAVRHQIRQADRGLEQAAKPIPADQIDAAVKLEETLREGWLDGMPTQAEMRKNPPGAVDKHRSWEAKHKTKVLNWKGLCRRLHASGISESHLPDQGDISNVEMYRPKDGSGELAMDNAQIPGKSWHLQPPGAAPAVIFSDDDLALLEKLDPELRESVALLPNSARRMLLDALRSKEVQPLPQKQRKKGPQAECPECGKSFAKQGLKFHMKTHNKAA